MVRARDSASPSTLSARAPFSHSSAKPCTADQAPRVKRALLRGVRRQGAGTAAEHGRRTLARRGHLRVVRAVQLGPEHHQHVRPVGDGEPHVGHAHLEEVVGGPLQRVGEQLVALGGDRGEQAGLVAEVVDGGRV